MPQKKHLFRPAIITFVITILFFGITAFLLFSGPDAGKSTSKSSFIMGAIIVSLFISFLVFLGTYLVKIINTYAERTGIKRRITENMVLLPFNNPVTSSVPLEESKIPLRDIPYFAILCLSFFVAVLTIMFVGGGFELLLLVPVVVVALSVVLFWVGRMLRKYKAGWGALLLSLFVISTSIVLMRLAIGVASDSPEIYYTINSIGERLLSESPDLPANYGTLMSIIFWVNFVYLFVSLELIGRSVKKHQGNVTSVISITLISISILLVGYVLLPLQSAWVKFNSPQHAGMVAKMDRDVALYDDMTKIASARGVAIRVYNYNSDGTLKSPHSYVGTCEDSAFISIDPRVTCRESADAFIMYYKMNNKYGYACGDTNWYGAVNFEPTGLSCN
jgi:hypothetical protein